MDAKIFRINYKSDFILTMNSDAGWAIPFCIKFWTSVPSRAYFVGFDGTTYTHCAYDPSEPTKLVVQFDDHHLPIGDLNYQIAYHFTVADFPNDTEDEVINPAAITTEIDGETYHVMLDFTGETAPEIEFNLPAYANEAERIQNELQRQQNEADRIAAELQREQATSAAVQGAENVNAQLNGTTLTVTNRQGVSTSVNTKGEQGPVGPQGEQGETGISIVSFTPKSETSTTLIYTVTFSDDTTEEVAVPKGQQGIQGPAGQNGLTPTINPTSKHWMIGSTDTGVVAEGQDGQDGQNGTNGTNGVDGVTPHIDSTNKHWMIGTEDTGIVAEGQDGRDGTNGTNGTNGTDGADGITPHIDSTTGNWFIGDENTGVHAQGPQGVPGVTPDISGKEDKVDIVSASGATLTAEVGKYYTLSNVGTLAITLPTIAAGTTKVQTVTFYIAAGSTPGVTFTSTHSIYYSDGFEIAADTTYEVSAAYNGIAWVVASVKIVIPT